eukprot:Skav221908  [mRNA]  locus=scaffold1640:127556:130578:+ [translate_table: standard]
MGPASRAEALVPWAPALRGLPAGIRDAHREGQPAAVYSIQLYGYPGKYYKGLGTSTSAEAREYFSELQQHELTFLTDDNPALPMTSQRRGKKADLRKEWITRSSGEEFVDHSQPTLSLDAAGQRLGDLGWVQDGFLWVEDWFQWGGWFQVGFAHFQALGWWVVDVGSSGVDGFMVFEAAN